MTPLAGAIIRVALLLVFLSAPAIAGDDVAACTRPVEVYVHPQGKIFFNYKRYALDGVPAAIARERLSPFDCLKMVDVTKGEADRQAITDVLRQRVMPKGFDTLAVVWEDYVAPAPRPEPPLPDDPAQYAPLARDEYVSLKKELAPLSRCVHDAQVGSARFTGQINGKKIARKIVSAGRGPDLLRDAATLPNYLKTGAEVPAADKDELVGQVSTVLWGIPFYVGTNRLVASRKPEAGLTLIQELRANAIFAYYGAIASQNCRPSDIFNSLFHKANER